MRPELSNASLLLVLGGALAAILALAAWPQPARAQSSGDVRTVASRFKVQVENYAPPFEAQVKILLEGARAEPLGNGLILLTEAMLTQFNTNGTIEFQAHSPQCIFDVVQRTIYSTGLLEIVQPGTKGFLVRGEGFLLQTNSVLTLSNDVQTVIHNVRRKAPPPPP